MIYTPNAAIPYLRMLLTHYEKWRASSTNAFADIVCLIVEEGLQNGKLLPKYTEKQILSFLLENYRGITFSQGLERGHYLLFNDSFPLLRDWLEGLRA